MNQNCNKRYNIINHLFFKCAGFFPLKGFIAFKTGDIASELKI